MSFLHSAFELQRKIDPLSRSTWGQALEGVPPVANTLYKATDYSGPPKPPFVNPNDALNAARTTQDQQRLRRGLLANIYAGGQSTQPVTGKTQLGT